MKRKHFMALMAAVVALQSPFLVAKEQVESMQTQETTMATEEVATSSKSEYGVKKGTITEINLEKGIYRVLVGDAHEGIIYILDNSQIIIDGESLAYLEPSELKEGMEITVVLSLHTPMTMSLPAMISSPTAIIVNSKDRALDVSYYDETLTNEEGSLVLYMGKENYIVSTTGERRIFTEEDVKEHDLVVLYSWTTRSIPPQTSPDMILILPKTQEELINPARSEYVSIRYIGEKYNYDIEWNNETKTVTLSDSKNTIAVTVGEAECVYNGKVMKLSKEVVIKEQRVYVSEELLDVL